MNTEEKRRILALEISYIRWSERKSRIQEVRNFEIMRMNVENKSEMVLSSQKNKGVMMAQNNIQRDTSQKCLQIFISLASLNAGNHVSQPLL